MKLETDEIYDVMDSGERINVDPSWRHGHRSTYVFKRGDKHYAVEVSIHATEGIQDWGEAYEVEPVTKTVTSWEVVK